MIEIILGFVLGVLLAGVLPAPHMPVHNILTLILALVALVTVLLSPAATLRKVLAAALFIAAVVGAAFVLGNLTGVSLRPVLHLALFVLICIRGIEAFVPGTAARSEQPQ